MYISFIASKPKQFGDSKIIIQFEYHFTSSIYIFLFPCFCP